MASTGFISQPRSFNNDTIPCDADAPNAAAYSSASALLLAMIFSLLVYAFRVWLPSSITPGLGDFRVSSEPAQSESEDVVTSSTILEQLNNLTPLSFAFQVSDKPLQLGKALLRGV